MNTKSRNLKIIETMTLMDDIFMSVFFRDRPDCVEEILDVLLPFKVTVESVKTNHKYSNSNNHAVIFDIYAKDSNNKIYDIEIQKRSDGASQKRARFYSSILDMESIKRGQEYDEIADTYVIFITEHDVLKGNKPIYLIERTILDMDKYSYSNSHTGQSFNDGSHIIYFNTSYKGECDEKTGDLIHDFKCSNPNHIRNKNLHERFNELKTDFSKKEIDDMSELLDKLLIEARSEAHTKGRIEGHTEGRTEGRTEKAKEIAKNMLLSGKLTVEMIAEFCNLSVEEVNALKNLA